MEVDLVANLIELLEVHQYTLVLRNLQKRNKCFCIPGFTKLEKVPIKIVSNKAKNDTSFRSALLESISDFILSDNQIDFNDDIEKIKSKIPCEKWLGLAALLLIKGDVYSTEEASKLINDYKKSKSIQSSPQKVIQSEKKEDKFRIKYIKAHSEISKLEADIKQRDALLHRAELQVEELRKKISEVEEQCQEYEKQIQELNERNNLLSYELSVETEKTDTLSFSSLSILAPNCDDILGRFSGKIHFEFKLLPGMSYSKAIALYDQIWVFPDVVSYPTYRMIRKWASVSADKVVVFLNATDLLVHAANLLK